MKDEISKMTGAFSRGYQIRSSLNFTEPHCMRNLNGPDFTSHLSSMSMKQVPFCPFRALNVEPRTSQGGKISIVLYAAPIGGQIAP